MKNHLIPAGAAMVLALLISGCESDGNVSARTSEKSAIYTTLKPWQKKLIDKGTISQGFTPDMVYIALGKADKVETKQFPEGTAELWTYTHYYPNADAVHGFRHANFTTESAYQPERALLQTNVSAGDYANDASKRNGQVPTGMDRSGGESIAKTGGAQGGSMEPADLRSYTIKVLFASGKVVQFGADENVN